MQRRGFVAQVLAGGVLAGSSADGIAQHNAAPGKLPGFARLVEVVIERPLWASLIQVKSWPRSNPMPMTYPSSPEEPWRSS